MVIIAITSRRHAPAELLRAEKNIIKLGAIYSGVKKCWPPF